MICELIKEKMILELLIAFYSFTNFFCNVRRTKSRNISKVSPIEIQILSFNCLFLFEPALEKIISDGSGASRIVIVVLSPPKHSPS